MSSFYSSTSSGKKHTSFSPTVSFIMPEENSNPPTPSSLHSKNGVRSSQSRMTPNSATKSNNSSSSSVSEHVTPRNLLLLPMSQTMNESLTALVVSTSEQLEEIWNEVGYHPDDRASQLQVLLMEFQKLCEKKIAEENRVKETMVEEILQSKEEMRRSAHALKIDVDESLMQNNKGMTLIEEIHSLDAGLEGIRAACKVAAKDIGQCRDHLVDMHSALGKQLEETWLDVESDLTQARREEFHNKVKETEEEVSFRRATVLQIVKDCQDLIRDLKVDPQENSFDKKIMGSLIEENGEQRLVSIHEGDTNIGIDAKTMESLTDRVADLHGERRRRKEKLVAIGDVIHHLWDRLQISKDEREAFVSSINGLGLDTIERGEREVQRLKEMKKAMMGRFIVESREKIKELWHQTNTSDERKEALRPMMSIDDESEFTEDLLQEHEVCISKLEDLLNLMQPILTYIEKREAIIIERTEYEEFLKDPERLKQRGAALTKQLMKEEKMSRRIKKDLPKITGYLEKKLREWHQTNDEPFLYNGEVYLDTMKNQEEEWQNYKEQNKMKLKIKQNEAFEKNCTNGVNPKPLPGRKKVAPKASQRSSSNTVGSTYSSSSSQSGNNYSGPSRPLADGTNRFRPPSRPRTRDTNNIPTSKNPATNSRSLFNDSNRPTSNMRARPITRK